MRYILFFIFLFPTLSYTQSVQRVEPPHWYTGMTDNNLQLMLYGRNIGKLLPQVMHPGIRVKDILSIPNRNYMILDLEISPDAVAKKFDILLRSPRGIVARQQYELKERTKKSSQRVGLSSKDAVYLITLDRFANGITDNDQIHGMQEGLDRKKQNGRHGGDIQGIIDHIDYIKKMGFTTIGLNPLIETDQRKYSYKSNAHTDYYRIDRRYGSNEDFVSLSKRAEEKDLKLVMDQVIDKCGNRHWWVKDPPTKDWINRSKKQAQNTTNLEKQKSDNLVHDSIDKSVSTLNHQNPVLIRYFIQNSIWWIEYAGLLGIDIENNTSLSAAFISAWSTAIYTEYPNFTIIGSEFSEHTVLDNNTDNAIAKAINKTIEKENGLSNFYDLQSTANKKQEIYNRISLANAHDLPILNDATSDQITNYQMVMAYLLTMTGIPQITYGTEILIDHPIDVHGQMYAAFPGGWKEDKINGFTRRGLSIEQKKAQKYLANILEWRKDAEAIHSGKLKQYEPQNGVYLYFRYTDTKTVMIVLNNNEEPVELDLSRFEQFITKPLQAKNILTDKEITLDKTLSLNQKGAFILEF